MERHGPSQELLKGKSDEVARRARATAERILRRNNFLIDHNTSDAIAENEEALARQKYLEKRATGLANDFHSKEPGITIYLTREGKLILETIGKRQKFNTPFEPSPELPFPNKFSVEFPTGIFSAPPEQWVFFAAERTKKRFMLSKDLVVRIEGKHGELWQNPNFNWDGILKE